MYEVFGSGVVISFLQTFVHYINIYFFLYLTISYLGNRQFMFPLLEGITNQVLLIPTNSKQMQQSQPVAVDNSQQLEVHRQR